MVIKDTLKKNNIKIKAIGKDKLIFYSSEDSEKALKALKGVSDYRVLMDKEKPVLNDFIVENHTDVKKDELKII